MNFDENVISIVEEEDTLTSSNCLEEKNVESTIDISDLLKKRYDSSVNVTNSQLGVVLQAGLEKDNERILEAADFIMDGRNISSNITSTLSTPIWVVVNKKTQVNRKVIPIDTRMLSPSRFGVTDAAFNLADKFNSKINDELIKSKSIEDVSVHNNVCNTRNLPNILRGPKIFSKSNTSSPIPFETEDNSVSSNNVLENEISEKERNGNVNKSHRKRKQIHNPLVIQEDLMNLPADKKLQYRDKSTRKDKCDLERTERMTRNYRKTSNYKKKPVLYKKVRNKISFSSTPTKEAVDQNPSIDLNVTREETKEQISDLNLSSEFDEFYKEQFHEDYTDHLDILTDALRECQDLNDSYVHGYYDMNSNYIFNSDDMECSKLQYEDSRDCNDRKENEYPWNNTNMIESNRLSDYEDYHNDNDFLTSVKDLESAHISSSDYNSGKASIRNLCNKNCLSSFLNDSLDDELCLENVSYNELQNSFNKDEARHLDTLLLEEKKCEGNLENPLNNDLSSSKINFKLTDDNKNITPISLSNGLEHKATIERDKNKQPSDQCDVLLNTDPSSNVSSDYLEHSEVNDTNLPKENDSHVRKNVQEEAPVLYNYTVELNYEEKCDKRPSQVKSKEITTDENLTKINKPKIITETLQCLLCTLTFTSKRTLALHIAGAHGGMYVILCDRCGRLFNKKCLFSRHFIHCGCIELPFGCQKCNKTYRHKSSLLHHLKVVHQIEHKRDSTILYKCNVCSKVYRKYGAFEKHLDYSITISDNNY